MGLQKVGMKNLALKIREIGGREIGGSDCIIQWRVAHLNFSVFAGRSGPAARGPGRGNVTRDMD